MENRRSNVDNELMASVVVQQVGNKWGWMFVPQTYALEAAMPEVSGFEFEPQGLHDTAEAAWEAGIGYVRKTKPELVRGAERIAIEGEQYRAKQKR